MSLQGELHAGLADPVFDSQRVFRAVLDALARPGRVVAFPRSCDALGGLAAEPLAILLSLADNTTPVWLPESLQDGTLAGHLAFHAGVVLTTEPVKAAFAVIDSAVDAAFIDRFAIGAPDYPDRSTTLILPCANVTDDAGWSLAGPGIETTARLGIEPAHPALETAIRRNATLSPLGLDVIFTAPGRVAAIPRSTRLEE
ncbi:MAG: phosphonate C-P lyase system protein PhnH [Rhizobiales bacterium NRL2]|jgi:alpha-D-ribose 1-methylphosphonate 5-triphosphate synthase subunit PhnH|nr:MAG: phosphonate C-P lyase system protein PhnH [Rhizobiales bacterium NRL2]